MSGKKIAFLSAILLLLAGFYYFYEIRYTEKQKARDALSRKVLNVENDDIESIRLKKSKTMITLEKKGNEWFLVEPIKARADTLTVDQILNTLANGTWERQVSLLPDDLADFGLADPEMEVTLSGKRPSESHKVLIGAENPVGTMRYVRVDQEARALLIYPRFTNVLDKSPDDLRDKHILRFNDADVFKVVWRAHKKTFVAEKQENNWLLVDPAGETINEDEITSLLSRLKGLVFEKIYERLNHPPSYFGLDKPYGMIRLMDKDKQIIGELAFGKRNGPSYYAKAWENNTVYGLSYDFLKDLPRTEEGK